LKLERVKEFDSEPFAVLATGDRQGPYASLVAYAFSSDGKSILFATPRTSRKYRNLLNSRSVALLIDRRAKSSGEGLMEAEALTIIGEATPIRRGGVWKQLADAYLGKHPSLADFLGSKATVLVRVAIGEAVYVSRFQQVLVWTPSTTVNERSEVL
jgi:nitroimidazol reductase NimA-like FMN-containing flavoprotein (pyridoxamine 5'-phosphate oxidase superfamily)